MREHLPKLIILLLLVAIIGLPILLRPADGSANMPKDSPRLVIYTPHNEQIRYEIERAFNAWRKNNNLPEVVFDWRTPGGTTDIRKGILSQYNKIIASGKLDTQGIGADLFFGGGDYDHGKIASGVKIKNSEGVETTYRIVDDPRINSTLFSEAFPNPTIGGQPLYAIKTFTEAGQPISVTAWTGVTLSSFGIVYNNDTLAQLGVDTPQTWRDLADPRLRGWVALADPGHSGSIAATFNTILRREGWTEGWQTLRMVYANARYFATSSDRVPVDVSRGDAAAGMCIDFYGRYQAGAIGDNRMGYADPIEQGRSMTATTADPVTLLRGAPSPDLARQFIAWLLTPDAQSLWQRGIGKDGDALVRPEKYELRRQPIRADLYNDNTKAAWVDRGLDPFVTAVPFPSGTPDYYGLVSPLTKAMAIDIHEDLVSAWGAVARARANNHPKLAEIEEKFFALPEEVTLTWPDAELANNWHAIHNDPDHPRFNEVVNTLKAFSDQLGKLGNMDAKRVTWRAFFLGNYREVVKLERE